MLELGSVNEQDHLNWGRRRRWCAQGQHVTSLHSFVPLSASHPPLCLSHCLHDYPPPSPSFTCPVFLSAHLRLFVCLAFLFSNLCVSLSSLSRLFGYVLKLMFSVFARLSHHHWMASAAFEIFLHPGQQGRHRRKNCGPCPHGVQSPRGFKWLRSRYP